MVALIRKWDKRFDRRHYFVDYTIGSIGVVLSNELPNCINIGFGIWVKIIARH